mmetsp:Transcript_22508/g.52131  ORF Transcript_22508/g.52131 Transcript_22508/m.52131 type:complete len:215 (+) Transcript_22508:191-835(+)
MSAASVAVSAADAWNSILDSLPSLSRSSLANFLSRSSAESPGKRDRPSRRYSGCDTKSSWSASALLKAWFMLRSSAGPCAAFRNSSRETRPSASESMELKRLLANTSRFRAPKLNSGKVRDSSWSASSLSKTLSMAAKSESPGLRSRWNSKNRSIASFPSASTMALSTSFLLNSLLVIFPSPFKSSLRNTLLTIALVCITALNRGSHFDLIAAQ